MEGTETGLTPLLSMDRRTAAACPLSPRGCLMLSMVTRTSSPVELGAKATGVNSKSWYSSRRIRRAKGEDHRSWSESVHLI